VKLFDDRNTERVDPDRMPAATGTAGYRKEPGLPGFALKAVSISPNIEKTEPWRKPLDARCPANPTGAAMRLGLACHSNHESALADASRGFA
jgi:hypothetical protein